MSRRRRPGMQVARPRDRLRGLIDMCAWEAAVAEARRVVVSEPDNARAYAHMAQASWELKRYDDALHAAESAIRLDPTSEWHHRLRGLALRGLDRDEEALKCMEEGVRLAPEEPKALHWLANCQEALCQWEELLWTAQRYERVAPDLEAPYHLQADALWATGDLDGARAAYEEALRIDPVVCPQLHAYIGRLRLREGRTEEAIEGFLESLRLGPGLKWAEAGLLYALRCHLDMAARASQDTAASPSGECSPHLVLATQLHVLALRVPGAYRFLYLREPSSLQHRATVSESDAGEITIAFDAWQAGSRELARSLLPGLGVPGELASSLALGRTAHYPEGLSLDDMLRHWIATVLDLERGYPRDADDWRYDLLVRNAIERILAALAPDLASGIRKELGRWDARFEAVQATGPPFSAAVRPH